MRFVLVSQAKMAELFDKSHELFINDVRFESNLGLQKDVAA